MFEDLGETDDYHRYSQVATFTVLVRSGPLIIWAISTEDYSDLRLFDHRWARKTAYMEYEMEVTNQALVFPDTLYALL